MPPKKSPLISPVKVQTQEVDAIGESRTLDVARSLQKLVAIVGILAVDKED